MGDGPEGPDRPWHHRHIAARSPALLVTRSIVKPLTRLTSSLQAHRRRRYRGAGRGRQAPRRIRHHRARRDRCARRRSAGRPANACTRTKKPKCAATASAASSCRNCPSSLDVQVNAIAESVETSARNLVDTARSMHSVSRIRASRGRRRLACKPDDGGTRRHRGCGERTTRRRHQRDQRARA